MMNEVRKTNAAEYFQNLDREKLLSDVRFRLVDENYANLDKVASWPWMGMEIVFYLPVNESELALVSKELLKKYDIDFRELYEQAVQNTRNNSKYRIQPMMAVLGMMTGNEEDVADDPSMPYVVTVPSGMYGATALYCNEAIVEFLKKVGKDAYILPSSQHEVLVMLDNGNLNADDLREMVKQVNDTEVSPKDLLSYDVFYLNREGILMTAA